MAKPKADGVTGADAGKSDAADEIMNLKEVAERIGLATRGKALSPQRVRMLTDRNTIKDENGDMVPGPLTLVPVRVGKHVFTFIADGDESMTWPDGIGDTVQQYIDGVKSGRFKSRVSTSRIVLHQSAKFDAATLAVVPDGWTLPEGLTLVQALEALATSNALAFKLQERKADAGNGDADQDEDGDEDGDEDAAKLQREQQINAERDAARSAPSA